MARPAGENFRERMKLLAEAIEAGAHQLHNDATDAVQTHLIEGTPVSAADSGHSGRARNNWIVSINSPSTQVDYIGPFEASGRLRIEANRQVIQSNTRGRPAHITNNLNYIQFLNDGGSAQAPANFVQIALMIGMRFVREANLMQYVRVNWKRGKDLGRLMVHTSSSR